LDETSGDVRKGAAPALGQADRPSRCSVFQSVDGTRISRRTVVVPYQGRARDLPYDDAGLVERGEPRTGTRSIALQRGIPSPSRLREGEDSQGKRIVPTDARRPFPECQPVARD
jgi:hypothetical protein